MTQLALDFGCRPALDAEDFLIATANREAVMWLDRWPDWPAPGLAIHGPRGCGKTHLTQVWLRRSRARLLTPETLAEDDPVALIGEGNCAAIEGAEAGVDERALLHLYNWIAQHGGHLLLTGLRPPARWRIELPDLRSRLSALPAAKVGPPDDALFVAVLIKHLSDRQLRVDESVVHYLTRRCERSFDAARRVVAALDAAALAEKRNITVPFARLVLEEMSTAAGSNE